LNAQEAYKAIVSQYVHYDVDEKQVVLTPAGVALEVRKKLLVYLVALQGWPFVIQETVPTDASPGEIATHLGLPGGTVRPILMQLADSSPVGVSTLSRLRRVMRGRPSTKSASSSKSVV
jgi:hypothetical protein